LYLAGTSSLQRSFRNPVSKSDLPLSGFRNPQSIAVSTLQRFIAPSLHRSIAIAWNFEIRISKSETSIELPKGKNDQNRDEFEFSD
jgi:hypothetical protein